MSDKETSTPNEIPLHEVVLQIMYEANKERPEELTVSQVFAEIKDPTISEIQISQVLKWLLAQKEVEYKSGKYSLDRFSFLEERKKDLERQGLKIETADDTPLHDLVLNAMFESNKNEPAKLTFDDIYWMISDPKVLKTHLGDVLNWLKSQRRVEYLSGKYSIHPAEFQVQLEEGSKAKAAPKKKTPKKKKEESKIVIPPSPEKPKTPKKPKATSEEKPVIKKEKKTEKKVEEVPVVSEPKKVPKKTVETKPVPVIAEKEPIISKVEELKKPKWKVPVYLLGLVCSVLMFYLLFQLDREADSFESIRYVLYALSSLILILFTVLFYNHKGE